MDEATRQRVAPTPPPKPGDGRSRRVQSIIKAYNSASSFGSEESVEPDVMNPPSSSTFKYSSGYSSSRERSYRLTSLDRLAQRQKLFEQPGLSVDEQDGRIASDPRGLDARLNISELRGTDSKLTLDSRLVSSDPRLVTSDPRLTPDPRLVTPDPRLVTPEPRLVSHDPKLASPDLRSHDARVATLELKLATQQPVVLPQQNGHSSPGGESLTNGFELDGATSPLQSKRELFFKAETPPSTAASGTTTPTPTGAITSLATNLQTRPSNVTTTITVQSNGSVPTAITSMPSATASINSASLTSISNVKESLQSNKENHVTNNHTPPVSTPQQKEVVQSSLGAKVEALKRELSEDNRERDRLKERDKGQAPPPPSHQQNVQAPEPKKFREVDYVGFATLPNQVHRRAVKKGFEFTLMVVGESGLGKSTLINSMFLTDIYSQEYPGPSLRAKKTVQVEQCKVVMKEKAVNLTLTVVDTPGFGDSVDNSNCWQPIIDHIESKYEEYLNAESRVHRRLIPDNRVHCCLYFIAPSGHGLKPLDIECMKRLHDKVNIIPVIAKADTLTPDECDHLKRQILREISQHKIKIYDFPEMVDEEANKVQKPLRERVPFAVVGANEVFEQEGRKVRGRKYPWGIVEVENMEHCDFIPLRNMLIRTHMSDLKEVTASIHYENYRSRKLGGVHTDGKQPRSSNKNPLAQMEEERREHEAKIKKMEAEMEQVFEMKVKEKTQKLKDSETDMQRRQESMKRSLEQQEAELLERRGAFQTELEDWQRANGVTLAEMRRKSLEATSREQVDGKEKPKKKKGLF